MIFSLSKVAGYAATRFGWALVKNKTVAALMGKYLSFTTGGGPSAESQIRAANVIRAMYMSISGSDDFFVFVRSVLQERWRRLQNAFALQKHCCNS